MKLIALPRVWKAYAVLGMPIVHLSVNVLNLTQILRTLVCGVEGILALVGVDNKPHGHVHGEDEDLGASETLPEVPSTNSR